MRMMNQNHLQLIPVINPKQNRLLGFFQFCIEIFHVGKFNNGVGKDWRIEDFKDKLNE